MARPVTLFTGQWADLPLEVLAQKAASWGYDGLELACWGDHFEVDKDIYCEKPLPQTIAEARAMVNAVRRYGHVFQTGSMQRSGPHISWDDLLRWRNHSNLGGGTTDWGAHRTLGDRTFYTHMKDAWCGMKPAPPEFSAA